MNQYTVSPDAGVVIRAGCWGYDQKASFSFWSVSALDHFPPGAENYNIHEK